MVCLTLKSVGNHLGIQYPTYLIYHCSIHRCCMGDNFPKKERRLVHLCRMQVSNKNSNMQLWMMMKEEEVERESLQVQVFRQSHFSRFHFQQEPSGPTSCYYQLLNHPNKNIHRHDNYQQTKIYSPIQLWHILMHINGRQWVNFKLPTQPHVVSLKQIVYRMHLHQTLPLAR